jgi:hypothetical protein
MKEIMFKILKIILFLLLFVSNTIQSTNGGQVILSDFEKIPDEDIQAKIPLTALRPVNFGSWRVRELVPIKTTAMVKEATSDLMFVRYSKNVGIDVRTVNWSKLKKVVPGYARYVKANFAAGLTLYPVPPKLGHLAGTELFVERPGGKVLINRPLAKKFAVWQSTGHLDDVRYERHAYGFYEELEKESPKLFKLLRYEIGEVTLGKPHVVPVQRLKQYLKAKENVNVPEWLTGQADFYFLDIPFTIHSIVKPNIYKYEHVLLEVNFKNPNHTCYEMYPIAVIEEMPPVKLEFGLEPEVRKGDVIVSLGRIFNLELIYRNLRPTVTSYGVGENRFYWKIEGNALKMKTWRRVFALAEVPKGDDYIDGSMGIKAKLGIADESMLSKIFPPFAVEEDQIEKITTGLIKANVLTHISRSRDIHLRLKLTGK